MHSRAGMGKPGGNFPAHGFLVFRTNTQSASPAAFFSGGVNERLATGSNAVEPACIYVPLVGSNQRA